MEVPALPDVTLPEIVQSSETNTEPNPIKDDVRKTISKRQFGVETIRSAILEILDPEKGRPIREKWNAVFVISCLFGVLTDPLFLFIPLINQELSCIRLDKNLKVAAVVFRSITDFVYAVNIIFQIFELKKKVTVSAIWRSYILLDVSAILPIPQVSILIYFTELRGWRSLNTRKFLNFLVIIQYVPRLLRIYVTCKEFKNPPEGKLGLWIKGGLNFLMYIFACHILGGFWYFFSVQRMIACWQYSCRNTDGCKPSTFNCHDQHTNNNIKLLKDSCPIDPSDETIFDFGIFLDALKSGLVGSTDYSQKLSNCFWWGLRNLSSLGSNLQPSTNTWENLFAALTSVIGMLLLLYLIGKVQMYMQVESTSKEQLRWRTELENMMRTERKNRVERSKGPEVEKWLAKNELPKRLMTEIMEKVVQVDLAENRDVDVENIHSILPVKLQNYIIAYKEKLEKEGEAIASWLSKNYLPMRLKTEILEAVKQQQEFDQKPVLDMNTVLSIIPTQLKTCIERYMQKVREIGEKTDTWLSENDLPHKLKFDIMKLVRSTLEENKELDAENILNPSTSLLLEERIREYKKDVKIGKIINEKNEEIDQWMLKNGIPKSRKKDIEDAVREELKKDENLDVETFTSIYAATSKIQEYLPYNRLKKLKVSEILDERILKAICEHLKHVEYGSGSYITEVGKPLEFILFVEGTICFEKTRGGEYLDAPLVWGEELLLWPSSTSFPAVKPVANDNLSTRSWMFYYRTTGLVLTAADLESIISTFRAQFDPHTLHWLTRLKKVPKLQYMDEVVLKAIFLHLKQDSASEHPYVENQPIASMHFIIEGSVKFKRNGNNNDELVRREGDVFGEELLDWVLDTSFPTLTPFATHTAVYDSDNEAVQLSITAAELKIVATEYRSYFTALHKESQPDLKTVIGLAVLKRVPKLNTMAEEVLEAISRKLQLRKIVGCESIIEQGKKPIDMILFVLKGKLRLHTSESECREEESFFGEELIDWVASNPDGTTRPLSNYEKVTTVQCKQNQLLVLMTHDFETVMSKFKPKVSSPDPIPPLVSPDPNPLAISSDPNPPAFFSDPNPFGSFPELSLPSFNFSSSSSSPDI